jgi:hypothetical protein
MMLLHAFSSGNRQSPVAAHAHNTRKGVDQANSMHGAPIMVLLLLLCKFC